MNKLETEFGIFSTVYDRSGFEETLCSEKPDIRAHRVGEPWFGVEITELFPSETDARTHSDPGYIGQILAGQPVKHRDDAGVLTLSAVTITNEDGSGSSATVQGIFRQHPSKPQHYDALVQRILTKAQKANDYDATLTHTNLIVMDHFEPESGPEKRWAVSDVLAPEARTALAESPFREIFWVTKARSGRRVYRPLQAVLLLERFWGFLSALNEWAPEVQFERDQLAPIFLQVAAAQRGHLTPARDDVGWLAVTHGWGIRASELGVQLADCADQSPPIQATIPELKDPIFPIAEFADFESAYRSGHELECELAMDARVIPELR